MRSKTLLGALLLALTLGVSLARADDSTSAADRLAKAVRLYDEGQYEQSRKLLNEIDKGDLSSEDDQLRLDHYLNKTAIAITAIAKVKADLNAGDLAFNASKYEEARGYYAAVMLADFATVEQKSFAQKRVDMIDTKTGQLVASDKKAQEEFVPPPPPERSLVDELAAENALLWQKAVASYRDAERRIREAVLNNDFVEARRLLDAARQLIEANRRYATPASDYELLRQQARDLEGFIESEQRAYEEQIVISKQREIAQREEERIQQVEATKLRQVNELMERARELQRERKLDEAVEVLNQVLAIDPLNGNAAWMRDTLEDLVQNIRAVDINLINKTEEQRLLISTTEDRVPYHENIRYPKNWLEIRAKRKSTEELGDSPETVRARERLKTVAPEIRFDSLPFEEVIEKIRALTNLNIVPNWSALEAAAVEKDAEVSLRLNNVSFDKVLDLILDEVGAGEVELAYVIDDGVISISTREDLSRKTKTLVYNVQDLLISVPTFRGQPITLDQLGQQGDQPGGIAGGRFIEGGGGGAGGGGGQGLFGGGGQQDDDELDQQDEDPLEPIIDLIQATIDPESWREAGGNVGSISSLQQQLIVTQTTTAHNHLRDLLRQLRQARALQIAVEARYITVSRNWVEQIGVDLDVVLNNGNAGFDRTTILDPATNNPVLVPRQFVRNGFTPGAPSGVGITLPTQPFGQPFGQPGLVPAPGNVGPGWGSGTSIPIVNNTIDLAGPADTNIPGSLGSLVNTTPAFQIFGSFLDNIQVDFLLRASQVDRRSSELDAPRLVLFNGQRATFEKFIEQDYIAALTPIVGDNAGAFQPRVLAALTGRSLDVQATASSDRRYVTMTIRTFTQVTGDFRTVFFGGSLSVGSGFIELATRTTQRIRTTVSVPDGGTLLIGGLKQSGERDVDAGVPILSRIPILKRAYSNTSNVKDDQVLLILVKPTIIIQEEAEADAFPTLQGATEF